MAGFLGPGMIAPAWGGNPDDPATTGAVAPQPAAPAAQPAAPPGALAQYLQLQQQILQQQQRLYGQLPGMVGAEQGALNDVIKLYQQPQTGPDLAKMQLAAGFFAPTRTGALGENIGLALNGYTGALSKQREQDFDRATKLAQLRLTQAQLASKLPQMQTEALQGQAKTVGSMVDLEQMQRDLQRKEAAAKAWQSPQVQDILKTLTPAQRLAVDSEPDPSKKADMLAKFAKGKDLSNAAITDLTEKGGAFGTFKGLGSSWNDDYGGYKFATLGDAANWMENRGFTENTGRSTWWSDYQNQKNIIRNKLFGSALTATEKAEFDKANIHPGMDPVEIRRNLIRQEEAARAAAAKHAGSLAKQGYSREAIESAVGFNLDELGEAKMRDLPTLYKERGVGLNEKSAPGGNPAPASNEPVKIKSEADWQKLKPGQKYIDPLGITRTKQ